MSEPVRIVPHHEYIGFLQSLLDPEGFGHAVTAEVRDEARRLLGMEKVETTKTNWKISEGA